ncbi:MAG: cobalt-precorrin-5B (C(1))-methyltransferase CbiD [Thermodesulfovibrionales bacterium]|nr:cobalt-precorrin-5B (C(1))-methyltransferase CbiD [Thermodesulfovibrionales bacterium]
MKRHLRSGYTTGACAAAAAKAATILLVRSQESEVKSARTVKEVEIPFPDGSRHIFKISDSGCKDNLAYASIIKDAGDDPDVTNGAEIRAEARQCDSAKGLVLKGGKGVGIVTKPGLAVRVGEPAINPVPRKMILEAVMEAIAEQKSGRPEDQQKTTTALLRFCASALEITISVTHGEELAKKTLNPRLGIIGGISILGTTGIVKPLSTEAWTATITSSMDVARAMGHDEIVLSAGRASELAHMKKYKFSEEAYVMMGDYLEFSLLETKKHGFKRIHLCAQWAKMLKIAMATPQTHVRHGAINIKKAAEFLNSLGIKIPTDRDFNTAREIYELINSTVSKPQSALKKVCRAAKGYAGSLTLGIPVSAYLVSYDGDIIVNSE